MPPIVPQALEILPQIIKHHSNHGHLHWPMPYSPYSCFNWFNFINILCTLDSTWTQVHKRVNGNAFSLFNKISCHSWFVKMFMLLAKTSLQTNPSTML
jgi:hypothetical protein